MNKLAINWQNFVQVELQLKFALRIRRYTLVCHSFNCMMRSCMYYIAWKCIYCKL